jgi:hypothetical protein
VCGSSISDRGQTFLYTPYDTLTLSDLREATEASRHSANDRIARTQTEKQHLRAATDVSLADERVAISERLAFQDGYDLMLAEPVRCARLERQSRLMRVADEKEDISNAIRLSTQRPSGVATKRARIADEVQDLACVVRLSTQENVHTGRGAKRARVINDLTY